MGKHHILVKTSHFLFMSNQEVQQWCFTTEWNPQLPFTYGNSFLGFEPQTAGLQGMISRSRVADRQLPHEHKCVAATFDAELQLVTYLEDRCRIKKNCFHQNLFRTLAS